MFTAKRPSFSVLDECFTPKFETGLLLWKRRPLWHFPDLRIHRSWNAQYEGQSALIGRHQYASAGRITIAGETFRLPRKHVLWAMYYGEWSMLELGHRNDDFHDDRIENLRQQTEPQKAAAGRRIISKTGVKGVTLAPNGKFKATITHLGCHTHIGTFESLNDARVARNAAALSIHGEFARITGPVGQDFGAAS